MSYCLDSNLPNDLDPCIYDPCIYDYLLRVHPKPSNDRHQIMQITFSGEVAFKNNGNLVVTFQFTDKQDDGTMKKDNPKSCIDQVLWNYRANFKNGSIDTSIVTSGFNQYYEYRVWQFEVPPADWETKLIKDMTIPGQIQYFGYYSYQFIVANTLIMEYKFEFNITLSNQSISSKFPKIVQQKIACLDVAATCHNVQSILQFCKESNCSTPSNNIDIFRNQVFWVIWKLTGTGFKNFNFTELISGRYHSLGLLKKITPKETQIRNQKEIIIKLDVDFVYEGIFIELKANITSSNSLKYPGNYTLQKISQPIDVKGVRSY